MITDTRKLCEVCRTPVDGGGKRHKPNYCLKVLHKQRSDIQSQLQKVQEAINSLEAPERAEAAEWGAYS